MKLTYQTAAGNHLSQAFFYFIGVFKKNLRWGG